MVNGQAVDEEGSRFGGLESNRASAGQTRLPDEALEVKASCVAFRCHNTHEQLHCMPKV
jgi:hypothetical protein